MKIEDFRRISLLCDEIKTQKNRVIISLSTLIAKIKPIEGMEKCVESLERIRTRVEKIEIKNLLKLAQENMENEYFEN